MYIQEMIIKALITYKHLIIISFLSVVLKNVSAAPIDECRQLAPKVSPGSAGACNITNLNTYYDGYSMDIDAPVNTIAGKFYIDYSWTCVFSSNASGNYQQLGLLYDDSYHSNAENNNINLTTNVDGILFRTIHTSTLAGSDKAKVLSIISAPPEAGGTQSSSAIRAEPVTINDKQYYCGSDSKNNIPFLESVRGDGDLRPGEYDLRTIATTPIVIARYTTSPSGMIKLGELPSSLFSIGAPTCKITNDLIHVQVNHGAPMNLTDFDKIQTLFNVPLECSSVKMDIPYKLVPTFILDGYQSVGGIGIEEGDRSASGVAYKIFKKNKGTFEHIDFTQLMHTEMKEGNVRNHNIEFAVSPFKISEQVRPGNMNSSIILELDYR
ncbi:hypothetical protein OKS80_17690 [Aeromonas veronii]|uniref:hypothetical protein n=1 Tax=Aeromonas veronii TaxID=654 RepID=UPI00226CAA5B|nr:hypothetical protein [Aeromonas veronii]MCX9114734.1 hypothetical protein [Aeromonas veronii]